jgi:hypothetical protein
VRLVRAYDRQAGAWACVIICTFMAAVVAWLQAFSGYPKGPPTAGYATIGVVIGVLALSTVTSNDFDR